MNVTATLPAPGTLLRLGRVSNLPTVWTNVIAATAIAGGDPLSRRSGSVLLAMTLFYVGGMFLNDAYDREVDARERPKRPIPSGEISAGLVFGAGFVMLAAGIALMALHGLLPGLAGFALAAAIVLYDLRHKANPLSPVVMGLCRALVYVGAATAAVGSISPAVLVASGALLAHVVGLTYAAKQENLNRIDRLWPLLVLALPLVVTLPALSSGWLAVAAWLALAAVDAIAVRRLGRHDGPRAVPQAVSSLIAAVSLVDALLVAAVAPLAAPICWLGYPLTRAFQRFVPGT